ncbi:hypothetical protein THAOC_28701, partial [Thalassiosira oceanica]
MTRQGRVGQEERSYPPPHRGVVSFPPLRFPLSRRALLWGLELSSTWNEAGKAASRGGYVRRTEKRPRGEGGDGESPAAQFPSSGAGISSHRGGGDAGRCLGAHYLLILLIRTIPSFPLLGTTTTITDPSFIRSAEVSPSCRPPNKTGSVMSAEYAGKRQRGDGDGQTTLVHNPARATSSADLESMLKQALGRIDSLERQHEEIKASVGRETKALREDICRLKEENKALQASTDSQRKDVETLKSKNNALDWSLRRLASKVREGWEYPVTIQPDEYWQNKGFGVDAITDLEYGFLGELKEAVSQLEHGVCDSITVGYVNHDEDLMPHWNALFRSFEHINPYGAGVELHLHCIEFSEESMRRICSHIRHKNISTVSFENSQFTNMRGAISELGKALKSPKLKSLTWYRNPIGSVEDMNLFTRALSQSNALDELTFMWNSNENAQALLS